MTPPADSSDFSDETAAGESGYLPEGNPTGDPANEDPLADDEPWISDDFPAASSVLPPQLNQDKSKSSTASQKHSAELFPIPPAGPANVPAPVSETISGMTSGATSETGSALLNDSSSGASVVGHPAVGPATGPLPLVETAFLASAASLMWLVNAYFPPGPLLRILFPLPIALVYLRWNLRSAWMAATVSGLLLTILLGPTRSVLFVMPYGFLGVQLGYLWRRRAPWEVSIVTGALLVALGSFFRIWLLSWLAGEDFWGYTIAQITQLIAWVMRLLTNWGWIGLGALGQPSLSFIAIAAVLMVVFASVVYLFTVHLAAWLVLERLNVAMPQPPGWVQVLIDE